MWVSKILILLFFLILITRPQADSDLGWHLRYGQSFFETGRVLKDNIVSFVWPDYQWVQASWGYDLILYQLFQHIGFFGISLVTGLISMSIFLLVTWPVARLNAWQLFFLLSIFFTQTAPLFYAGMRSQTFSTLLFTLVLVVSLRLLSSRKLSFIPYPFSLLSLPLLFLLWANLHGGFSLGLILLTLLWGVHGILLLYWKRTNGTSDPDRTLPTPAGSVHASWRRDDGASRTRVARWLMFGLSLVLSWITPLLNPWGVRIYEETVKHSTNVNLAGITEWAPLLSGFPTEGRVTLVVLGIVSLIAVKRRTAKDIPFLVALAATALLAFQAIRFIILMGVMVVYYLAHSIPQLRWGRFDRLPVRWSLRLALLSIVFMDFAWFHRYFSFPVGLTLSYSWNDYCTFPPGRCSEGITAAMLADPPTGNGFHPYEYGGYLSFRVPMVKTFLDGRMAAWERHGETPPVIDGDRIFMEKEPITFRRFDAQYHFQWMIIPSISPAIPYFDRLVENKLWEKRVEDPLYTYYVNVQTR